VRLTCKQKIERDVASAEHPSGIVKWFVEVFDAANELVAVATILTMVQKKQEVFVEMTDERIVECLTKLTYETKPQWGILTPQHLLEHLEHGYKIMSGQMQDFEIATPEKILDKVHHSLYNYEKFSMGTKFPAMKRDELEDLIHPDFETAKAKFFEAREAYKAFFNENPAAVLKNMVFGHLNENI